MSNFWAYSPQSPPYDPIHLVNRWSVCVSDPMLIGLDHIVLLCRDFAGTVTGYTAVFGREPDWRRFDPDTAIHTACFRFKDTALEIMSADPQGPSSERFDVALDGQNARITSLACLTHDAERAKHVLIRRGLKPTDIAANDSRDQKSHPAKPWSRMRLDDVACHGIKTFVLEREVDVEPTHLAQPDQVHALDHLVIRTQNPTRALAHYGGRLGLDLRLERTIEAIKTHFLFFKIGQTVIEIIHELDSPIDNEAFDTIWGLTWRIKDIEAAKARLTAAGVTCSEIRKGRKPGTRVMTIKSHTADIPTLLLSQDAS